MADRLAAVAGLDREAARAGLLVQPERRVPPRAGEDRRRQHGEPALLKHRRRPVPPLGRFAEPEHAEPFAGHLQDAPRAGQISLPRRGGLVTLGDAMKGRKGKTRCGEDESVESS